LVQNAVVADDSTKRVGTAASRPAADDVEVGKGLKLPEVAATRGG
jgi:hypothetical protein